jgi:hypothetical protein
VFWIAGWLCKQPQTDLWEYQAVTLNKESIAGNGVFGIESLNID